MLLTRGLHSKKIENIKNNEKDKRLRNGGGGEEGLLRLRAPLQGKGPGRRRAEASPEPRRWVGHVGDVGDVAGFQGGLWVAGFRVLGLEVGSES